MQAIAAEMNLSETAFFVPEGSDYAIRWFTPKVEVDLCGHATLASAAIIFRYLQPNLSSIIFQSKSGPLSVSAAGDRLELDFPARPAREIPIPNGLAEALGEVPSAAIQAVALFAIFDHAESIRSLTPDLARLAAGFPPSVGVTAPGTGPDSDVDFVSRYFAPARGVPEDPVTGSAHCTLTPYWAARLGHDCLRARQVSRRQGELVVTSRGSRVGIAGEATIVLEGSLVI